MSKKKEHDQLSERGLQRRVKRHLKNQQLTFASIVVPGFEEVACREITGLLPGIILVTTKGIVEFTGTIESLYTVALNSRIPNRILLRIATFTARSYPELFNKVCRVPWELFTGFTHDIACNAASRTSRLHHTDTIAKTVFDGIANHQSTLNISVRQVRHAATTIFVRMLDDVCTVSIDATGELLYKRGIRSATGRAPLRETTAAALLQVAGWERFPYIIDPCCGSGSIIVEALQMASGIAAGSNRSFAFTAWPLHNPAVWKRMNDATNGKSAFSPCVREVIANDNDPNAIELVTVNLGRLSGYAHVPFKVSCVDCTTIEPVREFGNNGLIISNLPFGKRITAGDSSIDHFYRHLGTWLKRDCRGWHFAFLVADPYFEQKAQIAASPVLHFNNGGIRVRLVTGTIDS